MKLDSKLKYGLYFSLKQLVRKGGDKTVIEIIKIILDDKKTFSDVKKEIFRLQTLACEVSKESDKASCKPSTLEAIWLLGVCFQHGFGVNQNLEQAIELFQTAAAHNYAPAQRALGFCYSDGFGVIKDLKRAAELCHEAAHQGDEKAQNYLAYCYENGLGVPKNLKYAFEFYLQAAKSGFVPSQFELGLRYEEGQVVPKNLERAVEHYQQAARGGHAEAQFKLPQALYNLGRSYFEGLGVSKDLKRGAETFQQAAMLGHTQAQHYLAYCYDEGLGVSKDLKRAAEFYQLAADQGIADAQCSLGFKYFKGLGVTKDSKHAALLYLKAEKQGLAVAQYNLGFYYNQGHGVTKDLKRAVDFYQRAASKRLEMAQSVLSSCYAWGQGVPRDPKRANLLSLAATCGEIVSRDPMSITITIETIVPLSEAIAFYSRLQDDAMVGFCYQFGLGAPQDLNLAVKHYIQAINKNIPCFLDLFYCYHSMLPKGLSLETFTEFYKILEKFAASGASPVKQQEALHCLAYFSEYGAPNFEQNLYKALKYYEKAQEDKHVKEKRMAYSLLPAFNMHLKNDMLVTHQQLGSCSGAMSLIAEYAYELLEPPAFEEITIVCGDGVESIKIS